MTKQTEMVDKSQLEKSLWSFYVQVSPGCEGKGCCNILRSGSFHELPVDDIARLLLSVLTMDWEPASWWLNSMVLSLLSGMELQNSVMPDMMI